LQLSPAPVITRDDFSALLYATGACHLLSRITVNHGVIDGQLGTCRNVTHGYEGDLTPHTDVRITGMVEAKDVRFNLLGAARRDVEIILYLNLSGRHLISNERQRIGVHDGPTLNGNDFAHCDRLTREEPTALDWA
jgi:hypothetical protein